MKIKQLLLVLTALSLCFLTSCTTNNKSEDNSKASPAEGYTLFNPQGSTTTYLMNNDGQEIHRWESQYRSGSSVYLLENGNLLRSATVKAVFSAAGGAGRVEEFSWDGELLWEFVYADENVMFHHDTEQLPNGNILVVAWERISEEETLKGGRNPELIPEDEETGDRSLWMDHIIEVNRAGNIVWEWHVADHLVQDFDKNKENFGVVAEHPELININYLGSDKISNDWNHVNAVDYNPELDQIMISSRTFSEIWIIDHNTTKEEAASEKGDLLYRWGNPAAYDRGGDSDQQLFGQHDSKWLTEDLSGAGNILIFNNGENQKRPYSSVEEIEPPVNSDGTYKLTDSAYLPEAPLWHYEAPETGDFYANSISGAQRLTNGNTLICEGTEGRFFEVNKVGEIIWEYINPIVTSTPNGSTKSSAFRAERYSPDYPGLADRDLTPGDSL